MKIVLIFLKYLHWLISIILRLAWWEVLGCLVFVVVLVKIVEIHMSFLLKLQDDEDDNSKPVEKKTISERKRYNSINCFLIHLFYASHMPILFSLFYIILLFIILLPLSCHSQYILKLDSFKCAIKRSFFNLQNISCSQ